MADLLGSIIKKPQACTPVLNPLHDWASYSYTWTLWWISPDDYNMLMSSSDPTAALAFNPGPDSYVIAEDSGLYPNRRLPSTYGLNFNIEKVSFKTPLAQNERTRHASTISGKITIIEPYGLSLIDSMVAASFDINSNNFLSWVDRPYMLELNFKGYDDSGEPIPASLTALYRKRFPIRLAMGDITHSPSKGTEYTFDFVNFGATAWGSEHGLTPCDITVTAGTVDEFFNSTSPDSFTTALNNYYLTLVNKRTRELGDVYKFDIDPAIKKSKIVAKDQANFAQSGISASGLDLERKTFTIKAKTPIVEVISRVISISEYIIQDQLKLNKPDATGSQADIFNAFRTVAQVEYGGAYADGSPVPGIRSFDNKLNAFAKKITYKIHQYSTWSGSHPNLPLFADSVPYSCKVYNYYYTGQNLDVIDFKLQVNATYFTPAIAFENVFPSSLTTKDTYLDALQGTNAKILLNPNLLSRLYSQIGATATVSPMKVVPTVNNPAITRGFGILNNPAGQIGSDVINSLYTRNTGTMVDLDVTILGDPTLIKQDDWLYAPSPTESAAYNKWESQTEFAKKNGSLRMDTGEIPVIFNINSILDMDTEYGELNRGLAFPDPSVSASSSVFSGQYKIVEVENFFEKGEFKQKISMTRYAHQDYVAKYNRSVGSVRATGAVDINQLNQLTTSSVNGATVLGSGNSQTTPGR